MNRTRTIFSLAALTSVAPFLFGGGNEFVSESLYADVDSPRAEQVVETAAASAVAAEDLASGPLSIRTPAAQSAAYSTNVGSAVNSAKLGRAGPDPVGPPEPRGEATDKQPAAQSKMSGPVAALAAMGGPGLVDIVARYDEHPELFDDEIVAQLGGEVVRSYQSFAMRAIRLPAEALLELAVEDNVDWLSLDDQVTSFSVASREAANVPLTSSANAVYNGSDVGIAVIDTGVSAHADLDVGILQYSFLNGSFPTPLIVNDQVVAYQDDPRDDGFGHGTHVAGIVSGNGAGSGDAFKGTAKDAKILSLQVLDQNGGGSMSDVMAALDWLLTYGAYFDIRVVNLSLGMGIAESNQTDPLVLAVERLWDAGMVVVIAAGNEGHYGSMTVTSPGNSRKVITVGSLTDNGTGGDHSDDYVSTFSSQGPTVGDLVLKPDLIAPGNRLVATIPTNSKMAVDLPGRVVPCSQAGCTDVYLELSGTSMATPMVSAAVALMLQKDPTLSPATVKARLMRSARKVAAEPTEAGAGVLDVDAALSDSGIVAGEALSPLLVPDEATGGILVEDTGDLWGDPLWGAGYLFSGGFDWVDGYAPNGNVTASGFLWTDGAVFAKGFLWTDGQVSAKGFLWTDQVGAQSFLDGNEQTGMTLNDDVPAAP